MEWHPEFRVGRGRIQVSFTGGHLCGGASTPASYATSDPVVQKVIEGSSAFRQGRIRLVMEEGHAGRRPVLSVAVPSEPSCGSAPDKGCVFEYGNIDDISDFLQFGKGVPLERLSSVEECFREAERLGVVLKKKER